MNMKENKKSNVWLYAVILFTSAFIVLLFAGYSQIKLNKNLSDYKTQVYSNETEKNKYLKNFSSAQEMNEKLNEEITGLQGEVDSLKNEIGLLQDELSILQEESLKKEKAVNELSDLLTIYLNGNIVEAAILIEEVDLDNLYSGSMETFKTLQRRVKSEVGKLYFDEGYELYTMRKYNEAAEKLILSYKYAPTALYSDKCLYYLANAEVRNKDTESALKHMAILVEEYPTSKYLRSAKQFISKYKAQ